MRLALVSLDQVWEDKSANRKLVEEYVGTALKAGCIGAIFPEMTLTGFSMNTSNTAECIQGSATVEFFQDLAKTGLYLLFGVVFKSGMKATNNLVVTSPAGEIASVYTKIHPFSYSSESEF